MGLPGPPGPPGASEVAEPPVQEIKRGRKGMEGMKGFPGESGLPGLNGRPGEAVCRITVTHKKNPNPLSQKGEMYLKNIVFPFPIGARKVILSLFWKH